MSIIPTTAGKRPKRRREATGPFPLIAIVLIIVIGLSAFATATYLELFDDGGGEPRTNGATTFSRSAIGHRAFAAAMRDIGIPVQVSRFRSFEKAGQGTLLMVVAPDELATMRSVLPQLRAVPRALLVLPKWVGWTAPDKPIWIERTSPLSESVPEAVLKAVAGDSVVTRDRGAVTVDAGRFGGRVQLQDPQFMLARGGTAIDPLITSAGRILLGSIKTGSSELWILSDPDLLSNGGLDDADNGIVALAIVDALLPEGGAVIIDETLHGYEQPPNLMRSLLRPPFLPILISTIIAALVLAWAGATRFGAPLPETEGLAAGKFTLIKSAAQLLRFGTGAGSLLLSYRRLVLADAINELHGPSGLDEEAQAAWLDRAAAHRGLNRRITPLLDETSALAAAQRIDAARAIRTANELYRWKQEILHGTVPAFRRERTP